MLVLATRVLPLLDARAALGYEAAGTLRRTPSSSAPATTRLALAVERLVGQRELVTRPLPPEVAAGAAVSGGAVLADGEHRADRRLRRPRPPRRRFCAHRRLGGPDSCT